MKVFHCDGCGQVVFFENVFCLRCSRKIAYVPEARAIRALEPAAGGALRCVATKEAVRLCSNYVGHAVCNWALSNEDDGLLCRACQLTRTIPDLTKSENLGLWYKLEVAKRRLVYALEHLGLSLSPRNEVPETGLAFDFLDAEVARRAGAPPVLTGYSSGVITVSLAEADDAERVRRRVLLGEPYRTLAGHLRHESGHFYWDRLIRPTHRLDAFRALFGDERADYAAAVARKDQGPPPGWSDAFVTAYAATHPWEDWAETWAHYLHMTDTLEMAAACGVSIQPEREDEPRAAEVLDPAADGVTFDRILADWGTLAYALNNLSRGLGNDDAYPFVVSPRAVEKLRFVHDTIAEATAAAGGS